MKCKHCNKKARKLILGLKHTIAYFCDYCKGIFTMKIESGNG